MIAAKFFTSGDNCKNLIVKPGGSGGGGGGGGGGGDAGGEEEKEEEEKKEEEEEEEVGMAGGMDGGEGGGDDAEIARARSSFQSRSDGVFVNSLDLRPFDGARPPPSRRRPR